MNYTRKGMPGEVYFVHAERLNLVKIGTSANTPARLRSLATASPDRLSLLALAAADEARDLEQRIHGELSRYRHHGEWFIRAPAVNGCIARLGMKKTDPRFIAARAALRSVIERNRFWLSGRENDSATVVGCQLTEELDAGLGGPTEESPNPLFSTNYKMVGATGFEPATP